MNILAVTSARHPRSSSRELHGRKLLNLYIGGRRRPANRESGGRALIMASRIIQNEHTHHSGDAGREWRAGKGEEEGVDHPCTEPRRA